MASIVRNKVRVEREGIGLGLLLARATSNIWTFAPGLPAIGMGIGCGSVLVSTAFTGNEHFLAAIVVMMAFAVVTARELAPGRPDSGRGTPRSG